MLACGWLVVGIMCGDEYKGWVQEELEVYYREKLPCHYDNGHKGPHDDYKYCTLHRQSLYCTALYFIVSVSTTVGYGDYYGTTFYERCYLCVI